jgi:hypothetical protein
MQLPLIYAMAELTAVESNINPNGTNITARGACMAQVT